MVNCLLTHAMPRSTLYVKTTTRLFWGGTADVEGTRNVFVIQ